jgi:hypothetical protein
MSFHGGLFLLFERQLALPASHVDILMEKVVKCLTLNSLRDIFAVKMTISDDFERFFGLSGRRRAVCIGALRTPSGLFWLSVIPRNGSGAKIVQKIFKKSVDT